MVHGMVHVKQNEHNGISMGWVLCMTDSPLTRFPAHLYVLLRVSEYLNKAFASHPLIVPGLYWYCKRKDSIKIGIVGRHNIRIPVP